MIRLRLLGPIELADPARGELTAVLAQPKRLALLAHLSVASPAFVRRDQLLAMFWPELDDAHARSALNQATRFLRQQVGASVIVSRGADELGIDESLLWCDVAAFRDAVANARFDEGLALYRDDLMPGFHPEQADGFEEWLERERARLRSIAARAARSSAEANERHGDLTAAVSGARRAVELSDPDEPTVRSLLVLLDRLGDRAGAVHAYHQLTRRLAGDFGTEPAPETRAVIERIRQRREANGVMIASGRAPPEADVIDEITTPACSSPDVLRRKTPRAHRRSIRFAVSTLLAGVAIWSGVALLGTLGIGPRASLRSRGLLPARPTLVAENLAAIGVDHGVAVGLTHLLGLSLEHSATVHFVPREGVSLDAALRGVPATAPNAIIRGSVRRTAGRYDVELRLVSTRNANTLTTLRASANSADELIPTTDHLIRRLRREIGESWMAVRATPPIAASVTRSIDALCFFAQSFATNDFQVAIPLVERAVQIDPEFALAWHRLRNLYVNSGTQGAVRDSATAKAFRFRFRLHPTDRRRVEEKYYLMIGDRPKATEADEAILAAGDSNAPTLSQLGQLAYSRRDLAAAERYQRAALARAPNSWLFYANLSQTLIERGKSEEAASVLRTGEARLANPWALARTRATLLYARGQLDAYERALDSLRSAPDSSLRRNATIFRRDLALTRGRLREWSTLRDEAGRMNQTVGAVVMPADLVEEPLVDFWVRRDTAALARRFQQAIANQRLSPPQHLLVGSFFAVIGRPDLARGFLGDFEVASDTADRRRSAHLVHRLRGDILRAEGRTAESLDEIHRGDALADGPASACAICLYASLGDTFDKAGMSDSAIVMYQRYVDTPTLFHLANDPLRLAGILERLAELSEARSDRGRAIEYSERLAMLWKNADPELQPRVQAARRRIARLRSARDHQ